MKEHHLQTPCLLLDRMRLAANCEQMKRRASVSGLKLRPHLKTLKCVEAADLASDASRAIAVSTLAEAEFFTARGFDDVMVALCLPLTKLTRALQLASSRPGSALSVLVEDVAIARSLVDMAQACPTPLGVWVEVDCGEHRTGFDPDDQALIRTAEILAHSPAVRFRGVVTHGGQSYRCQNVDEIRHVAKTERDAAVHAAGRLADAGIACADVSVGSTPTATFGTDWSGVTELRPGVYMAGDLSQQRVGTVQRDDIALSVLCTVISSKPGRCVVDAGGLALSKDRSLMGTPGDPGYGEILTLEGSPTGLVVRDVHQEHGEIDLPDGVLLPVGTRLRILPVHACMTAAAHAGYHVIDGGELVGFWPRAQGWN